MLGANVGTTLIVQALSFNVSSVSFLLVLLGVLMFHQSSVTRTRDLGRVGIGLGLMLIALQHLLALVTPYEDTPNRQLANFRQGGMVARCHETSPPTCHHVTLLAPLRVRPGGTA